MARKPIPDFNPDSPFKRQYNKRSPKAEAPEEVITEPGLGIPSTPVEVNLTESELKELADEFSQEIDYTYSALSDVRSDMERWLRLYRAKPEWGTKTYPLAHSSQVVVAFAQIYTNQVVARISQAIFGPEPHWVVEELTRKYADNAKPYERYLDWSRKNSWDQRKVVQPFIMDVAKLGTGVIYNDWQSETLFRYDDKSKKTVQVGTRVGPKPRWVALEDFLCPIGFQDPQEAPWCAHRVWFSWDRLERLAHQGIIENLDALKGKSDEDDEVRLERRRNHQQAPTSNEDRFGLWAPRYVWFRRDLDQDGWPEEYVGLLHEKTKTWLRLVANPSPLGTRPYNVAQFIQIEGEFYGMGIPEMVDSLQDEASTIHNQRRDRAHLSNIVMWLASTTSGVNETIRPESGKVIKVPDINQIKEWRPSSNVSIDAFEEDFVTRLAKETVGISDIDMSRMSSPVGRAAATTVMALMQEGARRFDLNIAEIRSALTEQGHQITELWQVYGLPEPDQTGSPEQVLDEKEAALVRQLLEQPVSLRGMIAVQLNASTAAVNKEVEKQSNIQLLQIVQGYMAQMAQMAPIILNPQVPPPMKEVLLQGIKGMDKVLQKVFQSHNAFDLETVLVGEVLEQMAAKVPQQPPNPAMLGGPEQQGQEQQGPNLQALKGGRG